MITSTSNKKIKDVIALCKKASLRRERGLFVVEGIKMFNETDAGSIAEVYVSESFEKNASAGIKEKLKMLNTEYVTDTVFEYMSDTKTPQGILALVKMNEYAFEDIKGGLVMLLDRIQDPGNLGTIMRTAEAAGVSCVIMSCDTADIYNPKTVRSTMGAIFRVPFLYTDSLAKTIDRLKDTGYTVYGAHLKGRENFNEITYAKKTAFAIGNESAGLSEEVADRTDIWIKIPMAGRVESLNASVASALLMYEYVRNNNG